MSQADRSPSTSDTPAALASNPSDPPAAASSSQAEMAQAFRDLARGEQHAAALERNLTSLENKLDAFLAQFEKGSLENLDPVNDEVGHGGEAGESKEKPGGRQ